MFRLQIWAGFQSACAQESAEGETETLRGLCMPAEGEGAHWSIALIMKSIPQFISLSIYSRPSVGVLNRACFKQSPLGPSKSRPHTHHWLTCNKKRWQCGGQIQFPNSSRTSGWDDLKYPSSFAWSSFNKRSHVLAVLLSFWLAASKTLRMQHLINFQIDFFQGQEQMTSLSLNISFTFSWRLITRISTIGYISCPEK